MPRLSSLLSGSLSGDTIGDGIPWHSTNTETRGGPEVLREGDNYNLFSKAGASFESAIGEIYNKRGNTDDTLEEIRKHLDAAHKLAKQSGSTSRPKLSPFFSKYNWANNELGRKLIVVCRSAIEVHHSMIFHITRDIATLEKRVRAAQRLAKSAKNGLHLPLHTLWHEANRYLFIHRYLHTLRALKAHFEKKLTEEYGLEYSEKVLTDIFHDPMLASINTKAVRDNFKRARKRAREQLKRERKAKRQRMDEEDRSKEDDLSILSPAFTVTDDASVY